MSKSVWWLSEFVKNGNISTLKKYNKKAEKLATVLRVSLVNKWRNVRAYTWRTWWEDTWSNFQDNQSELMAWCYPFYILHAIKFSASFVVFISDWRQQPELNADRLIANLQTEIMHTFSYIFSWLNCKMAKSYLNWYSNFSFWMMRNSVFRMITFENILSQIKKLKKKTYLNIKVLLRKVTRENIMMFGKWILLHFANKKG